MAGMTLKEMEDCLILARKYDAMSFSYLGLTFTLNPPQPDLSAFTPSGPDLPPDPGDPSLDHTTPIPNVNVERKASKPLTLNGNGEVVVDPDNPLNPDNPVDFNEDFPDLPGPIGTQKPW